MNALLLKHSRHLIFVLVLMLVVSIIPAGFTQAAVNPTLDNIATSGKHSGITLDAAGNPIISYQGTGNDLYLIHCNDPACTTFSRQLVDGAGSIYFSSVARNGNQVMIAYSRGNQLRVAHCDTVDCTGTITISIVNDGVTTPRGYDTSIALDGGGNPVIASYNPGGGLVVVHCNDAQCAGDNETVTTAAAGVTTGQRPSIQMAGANPVISYFDGVDNNVKLLVCNDANCAAETPITLDAGGGIGYTSLQLLPGNVPVVSYNNGGNLKVATCNNAACTTHTTNVVDVGGTFTSMSLNGSGNPVISHIAAGTLHVSTCNNAQCTAPVNTTVTGTGTVGDQNTAIQLNATGNPLVAYFNQSTNHLGFAALAPIYGSTPVSTSTINSFPLTDVGTTSNTTFTVTNTGDAPLTVSLGSITGDFSVVGPAMPFTINPGDPAVTVTLGCTPTAAGLRTGVLTFATNDAATPAPTYNLECTGNAVAVPVYAANVAPGTPINMGNVALGSTGTFNLVVSNTGTGDLDVTLAGALFMGAQAADFSAANGPAFTIVTGGAAHVVTVRCTPSALGIRQAIMSFATNDAGNATVQHAVSCTGVAATTGGGGTTTTGSTSGDTTNTSDNSGNQNPNINLFDPAISKIGFLKPGQLGVTGEQLEWVVTVSNSGSVTGTNVVISDTLRSELRIDNVVTSKGSSTTNGQTVTVTIGDLAPGEVVQISIFTTVTQGGVVVNNTACVNGDGLSSERCATASPVTSLPRTGETPWWRNPLLALIVTGSMVLTMGGVFTSVRRKTMSAQ